MFMANPVTLFVVFLQMSDGVTIFDDILPFDKVGEENLMSSWNVVVQRDVLSVNVDAFALFERLDGNRHIVGRVDLDCFHCR